MGKYKEIQIEVSDEVYSALEQLADDLNKAETIILNRTGKQELIGQRSMTVEHIALLAIETYVHNIEKKKMPETRIRWGIQSREGERWTDV